MPVLLGISPGTHSMGFAVLEDGKPTEWRVQSFKGKWTPRKLRAIAHCINHEIKRNKVHAIAVKIPDELPISSGYIKLLGVMNVLFERKGKKAVYYTLSDLKKHYCSNEKINKAVLSECIVAKHPDLLPEYSKEQSNSTLYYHKLFEAVAAAYLLHRASS